MNRLKELRKENNLSQRELGKAIGVTGQAISLYERGDREPKLKILEKLADYFGVSVDYLRGTDPYYKVYVYIHIYRDLSFLVVANSIEKADEMVLNKIDWDDELENFDVITYPVDEPMIDEI
ncbi:helix-turn-helix domain-containing protein [Lactobacillus intestinalis]|uniref:helix-turn-helix domain-containing protein n=1 Tax=Lactobacillus intestinalis TaxID=151781 RepID=UPI00272CB333|nr:helix-turn-helix transcriptional regulator [Lactobacillus intestinalis]